MNIKIYESKELKKLVEENGVQIVDFGNGILNIKIPNSDTAASNVSKVISQILTDNRELALVTMNTRFEQEGTYVAIATFISLLDIAYMLKDPGMYAYTHGISRICPPFM
jgi:hypothetical protein